MAGRIPGGKFHDIKEKIWGIELTADNPESVWKPEPTDEEANTRFNLFLQRCLLGRGAKASERNVVEVTTKNMDGDDVKSPIFSLTLGKNDQSSLGLSFGSPDADDDRLDPVTFRLAAGTGPVHLVGVQMSECVKDIDFNDTDIDGEDDDELDDEEEEEAEEEEAEEEEEEEEVAPVKKNGRKK